MTLAEMIKKGFKFIFDRKYRIKHLDQHGKLNGLSDEKYLKKVFYANMGKKLDLNNPATYSEKLQWQKLYDRRPEYTMMVDKIEVKKYVAEKLGEQYIIPTLGTWDDPDKIDFDALPERFVLKCNHNSGKGMVICKDKQSLDLPAVREGLKQGLEQDYYLKGREWPYKDVKRRILAEAYMEDEKTAELRDYKFFCFNGETKMLFIASDRQKADEETKFDFFDMDYNLLPFTNGHPNAKIPPQKPECFEEMKALAAKLSEGIPQVRVDFYEVNGRVYFGEMTFFHWSGFMPYDPEEWDYKMGEWIKLPIELEE